MARSVVHEVCLGVEEEGIHKTVKRRRSRSLRLSSLWSFTTLPKVLAYSDSTSQDASSLASHVPWRGRVGGALITKVVVVRLSG